MKSLTLLTQARLFGIVTLWMVATMMGLTLSLSVSAQTLEEVQASVGQLVDESTVLSKALGEVGKESILILRKCRTTRWSLSTLGDGLKDAMVALEKEADSLDEMLGGIMDEDQELVKLINDPQAIGDAVESLIDSELLDGSRGDLIQQRLLDLNDIAVALREDMSSLQSKSSSLKETIYAASMAAMAETTDLEAVRASLTDCTKIMLAFGRERRTVVILKRITLVKTVNELRDLINGTGPVELPAKPRKNQAFAKTQHAQEIAVLDKNVTALRINIYSTDGRLVLTQAAAGNRVLLEDVQKTLPNGVYLYAVTAVGSDGNVVKTELKKLVVRR